VATVALDDDHRTVLERTNALYSEDGDSSLVEERSPGFEVDHDSPLDRAARSFELATGMGEDVSELLRSGGPFGIGVDEPR
jgi:hypothetical protein